MAGEGWDGVRGTSSVWCQGLAVVLGLLFLPADFIPLCVCVCVFREVALVWVGFFLTLLKNKLQSAKNLAFHSHWLGADAFL